MQPIMLCSRLVGKMCMKILETFVTYVCLEIRKYWLAYVHFSLSFQHKMGSC